MEAPRLAGDTRGLIEDGIITEMTGQVFSLKQLSQESSQACDLKSIEPLVLSAPVDI